MNLAETLAVQFHYTHWVVNASLDSVSDAQYFEAPAAGGNCLNWLLGHLVDARNGTLAMLGQEPVIDAEVVARYKRGCGPITDPADAVASADLLDAFNRSQEPLLAALPGLSEQFLQKKARFSPVQNPDETNGSLLAGLLFHEAYHAGQVGVIRRTLGIEGVIK